MIQRIREYIRQYQIIHPQDHLICGVSGGADSVCLFLVLRELQRELDFTLEVLHVEHGIRGEESLRDMEFTEKLCEVYGVPCSVIKVDVPEYSDRMGLGYEEAARLLRYNAFYVRALETGGKIVLAHHGDDNAETVLFQMLRGSGVRGIGGIQPLRVEKGVAYIRPLLCLTRAEIEAFLQERGQEYCIDSTNQDVTYQRNRLRHVIFPELEEINSQAVAHINQTALQAQEAWSYINSQALMKMERICQREPDRIKLRIDELKDLHRALIREIILEAMAEVGGHRKDLSAIHVAKVMELLDKQSGRRVDLPYDMEAYRQFNKLIIRVKSQASKAVKDQTEYEITEDFLMELTQMPVKVKLGQGDKATELAFSKLSFSGAMDEIPKKPYTKWLDYDNIKGGFWIRKRRSGDYFINDSAGHRKKLKQYFIDQKIPSAERDDIWLLAQGNEVIDIVGDRLAEPYKVTADTKIIIEVNIPEADNGF